MARYAMRAASQTNPSLSVLGVAWVLFITLLSAPAQAQPEANILFIVDDSGSMDWEVLTRDANNGGRFTATQPDGTNPAGAGNVTHRDSNDDGSADCNFGQNGQDFFGYLYIVEFSENTYGDNGNDCNTADDQAWRIRNSDFNALYFNPTRTYTPWPGVDQEGSPFQDMPVTAALANPYDPNSETINLLVHNSNWAGGLNRDTSDRDNDGNPDGFFFYTWSDVDSDGLFDNGEETEHQLSNLDASFLASWGQTAEQVQQNFANWFSYYRSRELATKAAYGSVIAAASNVRMGLTTLHNHNNVNLPLSSMNGDATTGNKRLLLDALYSIHSNNGTPLRQALLQAGRYLECDPANGLFTECPVLDQAEGGESQQHFIVMMTDGFYNGMAPDVGNADGDYSSNWDGGAYADGFANTLADVAMSFYERDLHPNLDDLVPTIAGLDDAPHQHVVTYTLALGLEGTLSSNPQTPEESCNWPSPTASNMAKVDDLRHAAYNGRGEFFSATDPEAFRVALDDVMQSILSRIDLPEGE